MKNSEAIVKIVMAVGGNTTSSYKEINEILDSVRADEQLKSCNLQNVNGRLTPKVGFVYYIGEYTAPKVFNGLYYECLLTDQRIASHEEIKVETGVKITDWGHDIYKPERFGLRF
jgi:hypothetical protein